MAKPNFFGDALVQFSMFFDTPTQNAHNTQKYLNQLFLRDIAHFAQESSLCVGLERHATGSNQIDEIESLPYSSPAKRRIPNARW
jgi:hypothetical protein